MKSIFITCTLLFTAVLFSQSQGSIKGNVTDQAMNSEPVLFANVQLKGSDTSYQTNFRGNFEISNVEAGNYTLVIRFAGYDTKEIALLVVADTTTEVATEIAPIQPSFDNVAGMDTASRAVAITSSDVAIRLKK